MNLNCLLVNITFLDAVDIIYDVIIKASPYLHSAKFVFVGVIDIKKKKFKDK